jgi:two-component system sensor histidine kinase RegB
MHESAPSGAGNLRRLALMRWYAVGGQLVAIGAARPLLDIELPLAPMLAIAALLAAYNLLTLARLRRAEPVPDTELFAQICVDVTALTLLLFFSGGASNPFVSLYLPPITIAAAVLPLRYAWAIAGLSVAAYSLLVFINVPLQLPDAEAIRSRDLELAAAREEALRNERVIALGSLAAGAAHELGTPLATMAVIAGELARDPAASPEVKEDLALLREQIDHCKGIITGLAERAGQTRAEGGRAVELDRWLEEIVARWKKLRPHAESRVSLRGAMPAPLIVGEAALEQAMLNLFNNAADASSAGVEIEAGWDAGALHVEVRDRGPGIDEKVLLNAGRAFITTRPEGTGIGLFLAHAAVERLGGRILLANRKDGGAVTRIELPLDRLLAIRA